MGRPIRVKTSSTGTPSDQSMRKFGLTLYKIKQDEEKQKEAGIRP
jgi:hypothetical protein